MEHEDRPLSDAAMKVKRLLRVFNKRVKGYMNTAALAALIGRCLRQYNYYSDDNHDLHLKLCEAIELTNATKDPALMAGAAGECGYALVKVQTGIITADDIKTKNLRVAKELGELSDRIIRATQDNHVDEDEWGEIEKERLDLLIAAAAISKPRGEARPKIEADE